VTTNWNPLTVDWTTSWTRAGGDFDDELYARTRVDLGRGATTATLDVTTIVKEFVEGGMSADGFILSVAPSEGDGIRVEDLARFADLAGATLAVLYVKMPAIGAASRVDARFFRRTLDRGVQKRSRAGDARRLMRWPASPDYS
jgi:hypothetical protein